MKRLSACLAPALALGAVPAAANEPLTHDQAVGRLRACATAGATHASYSSLREALIAVRSLCRPQINRVYAGTDERVAADNPRASADLLDALRVKARRKIDRDLAVLVSTQTGLAQ
ncbi:MAG: hypothetical protein J0M19_14640 [Sphingomonadales bacterium]|nr:hypothetical protein [Sphingomonadales bacterium]